MPYYAKWRFSSTNSCDFTDNSNVHFSPKLVGHNAEAVLETLLLPIVHGHFAYSRSTWPSLWKYPSFQEIFIVIVRVKKIIIMCQQDERWKNGKGTIYGTIHLKVKIYFLQWGLV
jgi:hypothetical protein